MSKEALDSVRRVLDIHRDTRLAMPKEYLSSAYRNLSVAADRIKELEDELKKVRVDLEFFHSLASQPRNDEAF
jgi:hypothetical protein